MEPSGSRSRGLSATTRLSATVDDVSLAVRAGECVGLFGLRGSGSSRRRRRRRRPREACRPARSRSTAVPLPTGKVDVALARGVAYVPGGPPRPRLRADARRAREPDAPDPRPSLASSGWYAPPGRGAPQHRSSNGSRSSRRARDQPVAELSGGNQQKVVVGRALRVGTRRSSSSSAPTVGVDVASKEALLGAIDGARRDGTAVLLVSDDLDELRICTRLLVIRRGRIVREFDATVGEADADLCRRGLRGGRVTEAPWTRRRSEALRETHRAGGGALLAPRARAAAGDRGALRRRDLQSSPAFFTTSNLSNTAQGSAALGMVVVAETIILLTGSFDLSLQSIYGLAPMVGAWLIVSGRGHGTRHGLESGSRDPRRARPRRRRSGSSTAS